MTVISQNNVCISSASIATATADVTTQNSVLFKIWNQKFTSAAAWTIDLSAATLPDWGTLVIADWESNIVTITVNAEGTYTAYVWTAGTDVNSVEPFSLDFFEEALVWFVVLENWTGWDVTIGTTSLATADLDVTLVNATWSAALS